jgi:hypothetical protein
MYFLKMRDNLGRAGIAVVLLGLFAWLGLRYTQPLARSREAEPVREFLVLALAGDSAGLAARAAAVQPVTWALAAVRDDSVMVRSWSENLGRVKRMERGDTVWLTLSQNRSSERCSYYGRMTAALVGGGDLPRLARLSASCPELAADSAATAP